MSGPGVSASPIELRAVLFDAAGTLIELRESVGTSYARFAEDHGVTLPAWRLDDAFHRVIRHAPPRVYPGASAEEIVREEIAWWRAIVRSTFLAADSTVKFPDFDAFYAPLFDYFSTAQAWDVRAGVPAALGRLREHGFAIGVVSNFDHRLPKILQALELEPLLDLVVIPADCGFEKPDAGIFDFACERLGIASVHVAYVGDDREKDGAAAQHAGLTSFIVEDFDSFGALVDGLIQATAGSILR